MFPYLGASALTEFRTGPLALGAQFSVGTTFFGGTAGEAALGIGYGLARPQLRTSVLVVAGLLSVQGVAVVADCGGLLAFSRCNSGIAATLPFIGLRANVFRARGHFLEGGVFGLDYTLNPATQAYQNSTSDFGGDSCKPSTATLSIF